MSLSILASKLPLFMVVNMTPWLIAALIFNLIYDSSIILILMSHYKVTLKKEVKIRIVLMSWVFGFVTDICSVIMLLLFAKIIPTIDLYNVFNSASGMIFSVIVLSISIIISYTMVKYLLGRVYVPVKKAQFISLIMAFLTIPYYILLPISFSFSSFLG